MRIIESVQQGIRLVVADSVQDIVTHAPKWHKASLAKRLCPGVFEQDAKWIGHSDATSWPNITAVFNRPWTKGLNLLESMLRKVSDLELSVPKVNRRRRVFSESSGEVNIDRAMRGEIDLFDDIARREISNPKVFRMVLPLGFHSGIDADSIVWTCVAAAAATDLLENAGRQVELIMAKATRNVYNGSGNRGMSNFAVVATLKSCTDPLDKSTLVNALSPWFYRTFLFACQDYDPNASVSGNRGNPMTTGHSMYNTIFEMMGTPENTELIQMPFITDEQAAEAFIRDVASRANAGSLD